MDFKGGAWPAKRSQLFSWILLLPSLHLSQRIELILWPGPCLWSFLAILGFWEQHPGLEIPCYFSGQESKFSNLEGLGPLGWRKQDTRQSEPQKSEVHLASIFKGSVAQWLRTWALGLDTFGFACLFCFLSSVWLWANHSVSVSCIFLSHELVIIKY